MYAVGADGSEEGKISKFNLTKYAKGEGEKRKRRRRVVRTRATTMMKGQKLDEIPVKFV